MTRKRSSARSNLSNHVLVQSFLVFLTRMSEVTACGDGGSVSISAGQSSKCCSITHTAVGYAYSVNGGTHDDNIKVRNEVPKSLPAFSILSRGTKEQETFTEILRSFSPSRQFTVENDEGSVYLDTNGKCDITDSGTSCTGYACTSSNNNNCDRTLRSGIEAQKICIVMKCNNFWENCDVDAYTVGFYTSSSGNGSPPSTPSGSGGPPSTDAATPPPSTDSNDTSQSCKCSCCTGNYCSASIVASYNALSASDCGAADCRSRFPTLCPASGASGSVSASYSESTTSSTVSTTPAAPPASSDAARMNKMHFLAALGFSLMFAY